MHQLGLEQRGYDTGQPAVACPSPESTSECGSFLHCVSFADPPAFEGRLCACAARERHHSFRWIVCERATALFHVHRLKKTEGKVNCPTPESVSGSCIHMQPVSQAVKWEHVRDVRPCDVARLFRRIADVHYHPGLAHPSSDVVVVEVRSSQMCSPVAAA